jgi:TM2 domain-containing membrane protein YozV
MSQYYVMPDGGSKAEGPYGIIELRTMLKNGVIKPETNLFSTEGEEWAELYRWPEFKDVAKQRASKPLNSPQGWMFYDEKKKSAMVAALLNVLIPGVGYFYCGNVGAGIFMMLFCVLSFFTWFMVGLSFSFLLWVIGIIDGYLCAERANVKLRKRLGLVIQR